MIDIDPVPNGIACVMTTKCECGWEIVNILPEENDIRCGQIMHHLSTAHGIELPLFTCNIH